MTLLLFSSPGRKLFQEVLSSSLFTGLQAICCTKFASIAPHTRMGLPFNTTRVQKNYWVIAQLGALCCIMESSNYLEVEISHLVTDHKHNLSIINWSFICCLIPLKLRLDWRFSANIFHYWVDLSKNVDLKRFQTLM